MRENRNAWHMVEIFTQGDISAVLFSAQIDTAYHRAENNVSKDSFFDTVHTAEYITHRENCFKD